MGRKKKENGDWIKLMKMWIYIYIQNIRLKNDQRTKEAQHLNKAAAEEMKKMQESLELYLCRGWW